MKIGVLDGLMSALPNLPPRESLPDDMASFFESTLEQCLEIVGVLEIRSLNVPYYLGKTTDSQQMADAISHIAEQVAPLSRISLVFIPGTGLNDLASTLKIIELIGRNVGESDQVVRELAASMRRFLALLAAPNGF